MGVRTEGYIRASNLQHSAPSVETHPKLFGAGLEDAWTQHTLPPVSEPEGELGLSGPPWSCRLACQSDVQHCGANGVVAGGSGFQDS
eukprot:9479092-Pyramimonas_sp.AAC.1